MIERRGLLTRFPDPDDGRRTVVELTSEGWDHVVRAAPLHLRSVRQHVLDHLDEEDVAALTRLTRKLVPHYQDG